MKEKIKSKTWYPYAVAACIAVLLYVVLNNLGSITGAISTFLGYFRTVIIGCVLAYIMNPVAKIFRQKVFRKVKNEKLRWQLSIGSTVISLILIIVIILWILIPQLVNSFGALATNMDTYIGSFRTLLENSGLSAHLNLDKLLDSSGDVMKNLQSYFTDNINNLVNASANAGKSVASGMIAMILSVYLLASKDSIKAGLLKILRKITPEKQYNDVVGFLTRCDEILVKYIIASLLDALIIGIANAVLMVCFRMQYAGLISIVMGVTNLIPTIGPVIGGAIGAFILLLIKPVHALIFIIFSFVLQFLDSYVIKPKLFGNTLGLSGLLILISIIVFGNMFGMVGVLLAIPLAAILDFVYRDVLVPRLETL